MKKITTIISIFLITIIGCTKKSAVNPSQLKVANITSSLDLNKLCNKVWNQKEYTNFGGEIWYKFNIGGIYKNTIYHSASNTMTIYNNNQPNGLFYYYKVINDTTLSIIDKTMDSTNVGLWTKQYLRLDGDSNLYIWQIANNLKQINHFKL